MALRNILALAALLLPVFAGLSCSKTGDQSLTVQQYARFYARYALLCDAYKNNHDSLQAFINGLYAAEGITPGQVKAFVASHEEDREQYVKIQEAIVSELEKLNPRKAQDH